MIVWDRFTLGQIFFLSLLSLLSLSFLYFLSHLYFTDMIFLLVSFLEITLFEIEVFLSTFTLWLELPCLRKLS